MQRQRLQGLTNRAEICKSQADGELSRQLSINLTLAAAKECTTTGYADMDVLGAVRWQGFYRTALMSTLQLECIPDLSPQPHTS